MTVNEKGPILKTFEEYSKMDLKEPLITNDVSGQLLKIYHKYEFEHRCLCTSRFRHGLHQLLEDKRSNIANLCKTLHFLAEESASREDFTWSAARQFLNVVFNVSELTKLHREEPAKMTQTLTAIFVRLISEYHAIFAIEDCCAKFDDSEDLHKLRKRHEEEDQDCPEEIKLMKVDLDELSLNCSSNLGATTTTTSPSKKKVEVQEVNPPSTGNSDMFISRYYELCKKVSSGMEESITSEPISWAKTLHQLDSNTTVKMENIIRHNHGNNNSNHGFRKRKERHDSIGLDRKLSRPCSRKICLDDCSDEETGSGGGTTEAATTTAMPSPTLLKKSHHETLADDPYTHVLQERNVSKNTADSCKSNNDTDELTFSSSASSTCSSPTCVSPNRRSNNNVSEDKSHGRRRKTRSNSYKENQTVACEAEQIEKGTVSPVEAAPSAPIPATQDYGEIPVYDEQQHLPMPWSPHQMNQTSRDDPLSYNVTRCSYNLSSSHLDFPKSPRRSLNLESSKRTKIKQYTREISVLRKGLDNLEYDFEKKHGYRPSHVDKHKNEDMMKIITETNSLKKAIRNVRETDDDAEDIALPNSNNEFRGGFRVDEIERSLKTKRLVKDRTDDVESMTADDELEDENNDISSAFTCLEGIVPETEKGKEIYKDTTDCLKNVKQKLRRLSTGRFKDTGHQLVTIPEEEEIQLTHASPQHRISIESPSLRDYYSTDDDIISCDSITAFNNNNESSPDTNSQCTNKDELLKLHFLSRYELVQILHQTKGNKRMYRRSMREKERRIQEETGRKMSKEDRELSTEHQIYKNEKSKLKLVEALLSKNNF